MIQLFRHLIAVSAILLGLVLASAHAAPKQEEKVLLKITGLWGGSVTPRKDARTPDEKANAEILEAFLQKFPQYGFQTSRTIRLIGSKAAESSLLMAMAGRTAGDIIYVNFRVIDNWVRQNFLIPLDDFVIEYAENECKRQGIDYPKPLTLDKIKPEWVGVNEATWDTIYRPDNDGNWHVWSWPDREVAMALYYRRDILNQKADLLESAGLEVRAPRTWEEMIEYCKVLTDPTRNEFGFQSTSYAGWYFADLLWQGGVEVVERDENLEWHVTWDSPGTIDTVRFWRELTNTEVSKGGKTSRIALDERQAITRTPFDDGKAAFRWSYSSDLALAAGGTVDPEVLGAAPLPAGPVQTTEGKSAEELLEKYPHPTKKGWVLFPNGRQAPAKALVNFGDGWRIQGNEINASMWGISTLCTDPKRQRAAWEWLKFRNSDTARRIATRVLVENGNAIYVRPDLLKKFGFIEYYEQVPKEWREANEDVFRTGRPEPNGKNCQYVYDFIQIPALNAAQFAPIEVRRERVANPLIRASWRRAMGGRDNELIEQMEGEEGVDKAAIAMLKRDTGEIQAVITESVERAKRRMLDQIPEEELSRYRKYALGIVIVVAVIIVFGTRAILKYYGSDQKSGLVQRQPLRVHLTAWGFMALAILSVLVWNYYPLARGAVIAFQDYQIMGGSHFVGLDNFVKVFTEPLFAKATVNTLLWVGLSLSLTFFPPIFLAIILDEIPVGKLTFRIIFYLPTVMSGLVVAYLWLWMYSPSSDGLLNTILIGMGLVSENEPVQWLTRSRILAMICVILPAVWAHLGAGCIIYLAALKSIPEDIYEAADLDGAGPFRKMFSITLPYLKPLIIITFVGAFIGAFRGWENIFVMTGGGPNDGTHVLGMEVWYNAFAYLRFGYATAVAWVIGSALVGFTVYQLRILRNVRFTTAQRD